MAGFKQSLKAFFVRNRTAGAGYSYSLAKYNDFGKGVMDMAFFSPYLQPAKEWSGQPASWVACGQPPTITQTPNLIGYALLTNNPYDITAGAQLAGETSLTPLLNNFYLDEG
jgi:hypothetical protein